MNAYRDYRLQNSEPIMSDMLYLRLIDTQVPWENDI